MHVSKLTICMVVLWGGMQISTAEGNEMIQLKPRDGETFFYKLQKDTMYLVDQFYAEDMHFIDPIVEFHNRAEMKHYYESSYSGAESVAFEVPSVINQGDEQVVIWIMTLKAKALNKGKPIIVYGSSHIKYNDEGKAVYHRDYFDMGEMIYDHVPFVRGMVNFVDNRMRKKHDATYNKENNQ